MRPLHLTMTAFGPYADTKKLDMGKLGNDGLYLITGYGSRQNYDI